MLSDRIIYDCKNAACHHPIYTGKCLDECWRRYYKELGINYDYNKRTVDTTETERKNTCRTKTKL